MADLRNSVRKHLFLGKKDLPPNKDIPEEYLALSPVNEEAVGDHHKTKNMEANNGQEAETKNMEANNDQKDKNKTNNNMEAGDSPCC